MDIEGNYLNITKVICGKSIAIMILNGEKLKAFSLRSGKRQRSPLLFNILLGVLPMIIRKKKEKKKK